MAGGYIVDHLGWSWVFLINLAVGVLTLAAGLWLLCKQKVTPAKPLRNHAEGAPLMRAPQTGFYEVDSISQPALRSHWQTGHGAFSISESQIDKVAAYTEVEEAHHSRVSFQDEFRTCFEKIRDQ